MSPERLEHKNHSALSDIWSLGLVIIELAQNEYAYKKMTAHLEVISTVIDTPAPTLKKPELYSKELNQFIASCLKKDP